MCWSDHLRAPEHAAYGQLGKRLLEAGNVILVELDRGCIPQDLQSGASYPLMRRSGPSLLSRWLFGASEENLIVAAAIEKADGRDPPPPAALRTIKSKEFRKRVISIAGPIGFISAVVGLAGTDTAQGLFHPYVAADFKDAAATGECRRMEGFSDKHPGSFLASEAVEFMQHCKDEIVQVFLVPTRVDEFEVSGAATEEAARDQASERWRKRATEACDRAKRLGAIAVTSDAQSTAVALTCARHGTGHKCFAEADVTCRAKFEVGRRANSNRRSS